MQLDGVYWHGLDRPLEEIALYKTARDVVIHRKWHTDRRQDAWFAEKGLKLVRLTDVEFKRDPAACIRRIIDARSDVRAAQGRQRSQVPPRLRRFS